MEEALLGHPAQGQGAPLGAFCYPAPRNRASASLCPQPSPSKPPTPRRNVPPSSEDQPAFLRLHPFPLNLGRKPSSDLPPPLVSAPCCDPLTPFFTPTLGTFDHSMSRPYLFSLLLVSCFLALKRELLEEGMGSWLRH